MKREVLCPPPGQANGFGRIAVSKIKLSLISMLQGLAKAPGPPIKKIPSASYSPLC